jgi:hypothetical protein
MRAKGQSQIIQFMLFFLIGLAIFIIVGNVFKDRLDFYTADVVDANRKLINTHFSGLIVQSMVSCKECDRFNSTTKIANQTAGYASEVGVNDQYLTVLSQPGGLMFQSQAHNMLLSVAAAGGSALSTRPITLSYSKNQNILRIFQ